jgi:hypothetical protein
MKSGYKYTSLLSAGTVYPHRSVDILRLSKLSKTVNPEHKLTEIPLLLKRELSHDYT